MTTSSIYLGNNTVVELQSLTNSATNVVDTAATVTCTVKDRAGVAVSGHTWPVSMPHVSAGTYRAVLDSDLGIVKGRSYTVEVDAVGTGGEVGHWECVVVAGARSCDD